MSPLLCSRPVLLRVLWFRNPPVTATFPTTREPQQRQKQQHQQHPSCYPQQCFAHRGVGPDDVDGPPGLEQRGGLGCRRQEMGGVPTCGSGPCSPATHPIWAIGLAHHHMRLHCGRLHGSVVA